MQSGRGPVQENDRQRSSTKSSSHVPTPLLYTEYLITGRGAVNLGGIKPDARVSTGSRPQDKVAIARDLALKLLRDSLANAKWDRVWTPRSAGVHDEVDVKASHLVNRAVQ